MKDPSVLLARALALAWAGFWMVFFVAESAVWHTPLPAALPWVGLGLLFLILALAPWRWEMTGGILLTAAGVAAAVVYAIRPPAQLPLAGRVFTDALFGVPPLVAGILFAVHVRREHLSTGRA